MQKIEIICNECSKHYIVIDLEESQPSFCPYCSEPIFEFKLGEDE